MIRASTYFDYSTFFFLLVGTSVHCLNQSETRNILFFLKKICLQEINFTIFFCTLRFKKDRKYSSALKTVLQYLCLKNRHTCRTQT
jgi:hypothetical protein